MICQYYWDEYSVLWKAQTLLGSDDDAAKQIVNHFCRKVRKYYIHYWHQVKMTEVEVYGENSFFHAVENGKYIPLHLCKDCGSGKWPISQSDGSKDITAEEDTCSIGATHEYEDGEGVGN